MSICDALTDDKMALIASAVRKWANALDYAGLNPMMHIDEFEAAAVTDLMALAPTERTILHDGEQLDHSEG